MVDFNRKESQTFLRDIFNFNKRDKPYRPEKSERPKRPVYPEQMQVKNPSEGVKGV